MIITEIKPTSAALPLRKVIKQGLFCTFQAHSIICSHHVGHKKHFSTVSQVVVLLENTISTNWKTNRKGRLNVGSTEEPVIRVDLELV